MKKIILLIACILFLTGCSSMCNSGCGGDGYYDELDDGPCSTCNKPNQDYCYTCEQDQYYGCGNDYYCNQSY